jgi:hypothetical protein
LVQIPVRGGGLMVVEADEADFTDDELVLATGASGQVERAAQTLEDSLDSLQRPVQVVLDRLRTMSPASCCVQFGLKMGGETGIIVAKGTAEVNFNVTLTWFNPELTGQPPSEATGTPPS